MSCSLYYKPIINNGTGIGGTSTLHKYLENAFGTLPTTIGAKDIKTLRGIAACGYDESIEQLIEGINNLGQVELYAEY